MMLFGNKSTAIDTEFEFFSLSQDILQKVFKDKFDNESHEANDPRAFCGVLKASCRAMNLHPTDSIFFH
jgi:hypothetical protein